MDQKCSFRYHVDLVMCIDATRSMGPFLKEVKKISLEFYPKLCAAMVKENMEVERVRVKVIAFRDYGENDYPAMMQSDFFELPEDDEAFSSFLAGIRPLGGGDNPENSLEAISLALKSQWTTEGDKNRHVVVLFTDDAALDFSDRADCPGYPDGMPKNLEELGDWWGGYSQALNSTYEPHGGRMVIFAPEEKEPWGDMYAWERVWVVPSKAGAGLSGVEMNQVIALIAHTIDD